MHRRASARVSTCPTSLLCSADHIMRPLPELTRNNAWLWTSGAAGVLRIQRCDACAAFVPPPAPICPACRSREWTATPVSGRGTVAGFTVNSHQWLPSMDPPYVIAVVALGEDPGVRLTTNVVGCDPHSVHVGQEVRVCFEQHDDVWLPLFEPTGATLDNPIPAPERPRPRPPRTSERFEHRSV